MTKFVTKYPWCNKISRGCVVTKYPWNQGYFVTTHPRDILLHQGYLLQGNSVTGNFCYRDNLLQGTFVTGIFCYRELSNIRDILLQGNFVTGNIRFGKFRNSINYWPHKINKVCQQCNLFSFQEKAAKFWTIFVFLYFPCKN